MDALDMVSDTQQQHQQQQHHQQHNTDSHSVTGDYPMQCLEIVNASTGCTNTAIANAIADCIDTVKFCRIACATATTHNMYN